ncbi:MAG: glycosyl hydrolase 53 family protein [Bacteroidaceae bacterium]|nr:glycosyl hydrolase 53 family protein [Bacteroidaceae bacterium]
MMKKRIVCALLMGGAAMVASAQKYVGGDISLLPKYEQNGAKYYTNDGKPCDDMLTFFQSVGHNAMRVRLFVDPTKAPTEEKGQGVCQDLAYVIQLARRIKDQGMALMLDFHYSDSWADPAKQFTPSAWCALNETDLNQKIYDYTRDCLTQLKEAGAAPDFIQTGNEISYGMLWGERDKEPYKKYYAGKTNNRARFSSLLKQAGKACREVCPEARIVLHTERVANPAYASTFYREMTEDGVDFDIMGLSYYPYWHGNLSKLATALTMLETSQPDKQLMLVEVGYYHQWQPSDVTNDFSKTWPISDDGQNAFARDLLAELQKHDRVTGLFWWAMEANECGLDWATKRVTDAWYNAGLFDNQTGRARKALTTIGSFAIPTGIESPSRPAACAESYDVSGRPFRSNGRAIKVMRGRKVLVR